MTKSGLRWRPSTMAGLTALVAGLALETAALGDGLVTDYRRAALFQNFPALIKRTEFSAHWSGNGNSFWYLNRDRNKTRFLRVDPQRGSVAPVFDHVRLAAALGKALGRKISADSLPFDNIVFRDAGSAIAFEVDAAGMKCDLVLYNCEAAPPPERPGEVVSPDGTYAVFVRAHNLWSRNTVTGSARQLSYDGVADFGYDPIDMGAEVSAPMTEEIVKPRVVFSPDSRRLLAVKFDIREVRKLTLLETPRSGGAIPHQYHFPLVGDKDVLIATPTLFDMAAGTAIRLNAAAFPRTGSDAIMTWDDGSHVALYTEQTRGYRKVLLHAVNAVTGEMQPPILEESPTEIDRAESAAASPGGRNLFWLSERDGWKHLYRFDGKSGRLENQVTKGDWTVSKIVHVDAKGGWVYLIAGGRERGQDPYYGHLYRVRFDGSGLTLLTKEGGDHDITMSPDGRYFIDTWSRIDIPPVTVLRSADGRFVRELQRADIGALEALGWRPPLRFSALAADGKTKVYGAAFFPTTFDPNRKYPVIDGVYPGPQTIRTSKSFGERRVADDLALAELGFIVVTVDGRGTPGRSRAFRSISYGRLGMAGGLEDHVAVLRQLGGRCQALDLDRVGVYGHSGGGFASARAMLLYPDFFKVAVSSAGNHDQRSYFSGWGERYQGYPVDDAAYDAQSNASLAARLKGKLLLAHGTLDDNVPPDNTYQLAHALIDANKSFDMLILPDRNHALVDLSRGKAGLGAGQDLYFSRIRWDYFVRNLMGKEPPKDFMLSRMTKIADSDILPNKVSVVSPRLTSVCLKE